MDNNLFHRNRNQEFNLGFLVDLCCNNCMGIGNLLITIIFVFLLLQGLIPGKHLKKCMLPKKKNIQDFLLFTKS